MRIITWNCNMAFRKKAEYILGYLPDIIVVPECEHPDKIILKESLPSPNDTFWFGKNQNKGLAVFSFGDYKIRPLSHNSSFKFILPLNIFNNKISLTVFAIWAQKPEYHDCYTEQVWNAVHFYNELLAEENVILIGDFNSNSIWDKPKRLFNHTNLVDLLIAKGIFSAYQHFHNQKHGGERDSTLFMHRKNDRPYHIDYCFASKNLIDKMTNVEIGPYENWTTYSDHNPLIVDLAL